MHNRKRLTRNAWRARGVLWDYAKAIRAACDDLDDPVNAQAAEAQLVKFIAAVNVFGRCLDPDFKQLDPSKNPPPRAKRRRKLSRKQIDAGLKRLKALAEGKKSGLPIARESGQKPQSR